MKSARERANKWSADCVQAAREGKSVEDFPNLDEVFLADRRETVAKLQPYLVHTGSGEVMDLNWTACQGPGDCTCGLDAAIEQILETKGDNDA